MRLPEFVTVVIQADRLVCIAFQRSGSKKSLLFNVRAYRCYQPCYLVCDKQSLYSLSFVSKSIHEFLTTYRLCNAFVLLGFCSETLYENFYFLERDTLSPSEFAHDHKSLIWNSCVIEESEQKAMKVLYYVYGLTRLQLFQYQLAALYAPFNCIFMSSLNRALLHLLWSVRGAKISADIIVGDALDFSSQVPTFFQLINNNAEFEKISMHDKEVLCGALGLHLLGEQYESI